MSTTAYTKPNTEDKKGLALQVDQLIDQNNNAVNVSDIAAALGATAGTLKTTRGTVAAAGSTNADAAAITAGYCNVTAADGTKGGILPVMVGGQLQFVKNNAAAVLKVYPFAGAAINALTATTGALSVAANTAAIFICDSSTQIWSLPLLPS